MKNNDRLKKNLEQHDLFMDDMFFERCEKFTSLLKEWGKIHNLTSLNSLNDHDIEANIIDSVFPLTFIDSFESFADIGTGAGYPGMIIAMARPDIKAVLIEPRLKRVAFLNFVKNILGLKNIEIIQKRVEDVHNMSFDLITSRAVTNTNLLLDITKNISSNYTKYLFYKGSICEDEVFDTNIINYDIVEFGEHRNYLYIKSGVEK